MNLLCTIEDVIIVKRWIFHRLDIFCLHFVEKTVISLFFGVSISLFGGFDLSIGVFVILFLVDFIFGIVTAYKKNEINSRKMKNGLLKILLYFLVIIAAHHFDTWVLSTASNLGFVFDGYFFKTIVVGYIIITEFLSILEHASDLGVPVPGIIVSKVKFMKKKLEEK